MNESTQEIAVGSGVAGSGEADAREHMEVASFQAVEGKTWNHPVVVENRFYVRNSQEAACFQLPMVEAKVASLR